VILTHNDRHDSKTGEVTDDFRNNFVIIDLLNQSSGGPPLIHLKNRHFGADSANLA